MSQPSQLGSVEKAVDAAASFIGPFVDKNPANRGSYASSTESESNSILDHAFSHLHAINAADLASAPDAPYDSSLAGVVYGLLDIIVVVGILPHLSAGLKFSQRPQTVLKSAVPITPVKNEATLEKVVLSLVPILEQRGTGVQPLLSQRALPDIYTALLELCFAPSVDQQTRLRFASIYQKVIGDIPTARLLSILTTIRQQPLPVWLKPVLAKELALVPLRPHGVRHTVEFLSLAYLAKNSQLPQDNSGSQSQIPIPLQVIAQVAQLLVLPPEGTSQDLWLHQLAPQLLDLLDGSQGGEFSRAAGDIIASILSKKSSGAPGSAGWGLFALPQLQALYPKNVKLQESGQDKVVVQELKLKIALQRLATITSSGSHPGLVKRLAGPLVFPLWAIMVHALSRPSLNPEWSLQARTLLCRYIQVTSDVKKVDDLGKNMFWDGDDVWTFMPGSHGGIEIRLREQNNLEMNEVNNLLTRVGALDTTISRFVSLLAEAKASNGLPESLFIEVTKRWLRPDRNSRNTILEDSDHDPLAALTDAMLSKALATQFKEQIAQNPESIVELMGQLIHNFVNEHTSRVREAGKRGTVTRQAMGEIIGKSSVPGKAGDDGDITDDEVASFAIGVLLTLVPSPEFQQTANTVEKLKAVVPYLNYLVQSDLRVPISHAIQNSAENLLSILNDSPSNTTNTKPSTISRPLDEYRAVLQTVRAELTSPDPPDRTRALHSLHRLIKNPVSLPVIDIVSMTHMVLAASLADPDSYVHTAALPVLVDLAACAPALSIRILVDAFIDIEEQSLKLGKAKDTEEKMTELRNALDYRLRVGEVLNKLCLQDDVWRKLSREDTVAQYRCLKLIFEACLSLASHRGRRSKTQTTREQHLESERMLKEEGEAAWGGPIPNLYETADEDPKHRAELDALLKITQGWEDTGIEEDIRLRASALSVLSSIFEHRAALLSQAMVEAGLQTTLLVLTLETSEPKAMLRRAAVLVIMALLRSLDADIEHGRQESFRLSLQQQGEMERIVKWVKDEDVDDLVKDHATNVVEGMETLRMKELLRMNGGNASLEPRLGLGDRIAGLDIQPNLEENKGPVRMIEELE